MKAEYIQPFVTAAIQVLETELGVSARRGELSVQHTDLTTREVTVLIGITGEVEGTVLYGTDRRVVNEMVSIMMGEPQETFDDTSKSAVSELGNVISGQAAMIFEQQGRDCTISPPNLIVGEGTQLSSMGIPKLIIPLEIGFGSLDLAVSLRERKT